MSFQQYSVSWSDLLIKHVEARLKDLHGAIHAYYKENSFATSVEDKCARADAKAGDADAGPADTSSVLDVVSPVGSFLLRTCVHSCPHVELHAERGVGADLVLTIPAERCSQEDLQDGNYLVVRQAFLEEIETHLHRLVSAASAKVASLPSSESRKTSGAASSSAAGEDASDAAMAAAERLSQMVIARMPIHGCYANSEKEILRVRFLRPRQHAPVEPSSPYEMFYVDLHVRPGQHAGRATSAAATRKHPYYSYLVLEDYMMPSYLKRIHKMCVECDGLRRALVILKCWAHHSGLMAAASGHQEGLNGFLLACMLLKLQEDGILSGTTSEENATRAVWIRLSHGYFLSSTASSGAKTASSAPTAAAAAAAVGPVPAAEERGEAAVLRLRGEVMNMLFRTSSDFFKNTVQRAAEDALVNASAMDVFKVAPFQPLQLRFDVALTVQDAGLEREPGAARTDSERTRGGSGVLTGRDSLVHREAAALCKSAAYWGPLAQRTRELCTATLTTALVHRANFVSAWRTGRDTAKVVVRLTSEAEGRSVLTRGPAIEDAPAVEVFNAFWGHAHTSTRQFPDSAIYRCVLWSLPEIVGSCAMAPPAASRMVRKVCEFALRQHTSPSTEVSLLLGGLEGFLAERIGGEWRDAAQLMQRSLHDATVEVQKLIASLPKAVLPCKVTEFGVIAASERSTEVFPVRPHLALTRTTDDLDSECYTGLSVAPTIEPVHCVLSIDDKGKIPDTMEAIGMMKGAICAQLAKYIQHHDQHTSSLQATATGQSVDIVCRGYLFRVYVAHYREVSLLRALQREPEANLLEQKLFWTVQHAKFIRSLVYGHPSYANAARLAKRWVGAMLLSEFVAAEAIELLVANAYLGEVGSSSNGAALAGSTSSSSSSFVAAPRTSVGGFVRFIQLLASHDWSVPLVLPYTDDPKDPETAARKLLRQPGQHQAVFIAAPYAPTASPFTLSTPRPMILHRLVQLAKGVLSLLITHLAPPAFPCALPPAAVSAGSSAEAAAVAAAAAAASAFDQTCDPHATERMMFLSSPAAFDFSMLFHPQLILQPDRCLRVHAARGAVADAGAGLGVDAVAAAGGHAVVDALAAAATAGGVPREGGSSAAVANRPVVRVWQLDELDAAQSREYLAALIEREPAAHAVRSIRTALRDQGMVFYDALAPEALFVVGVTETPVLRRSQQMHDEALRVCRGALLPAVHSTFTLPAASAHVSTTLASPSPRKKKGPSDSRLAGADAQTLLQAKADMSDASDRNKKHRTGADAGAKQKRQRGDAAHRDGAMSVAATANGEAPPRADKKKSKKPRKEAATS